MSWTSCLTLEKIVLFNLERCTFRFCDYKYQRRLPQHHPRRQQPSGGFWSGTPFAFEGHAKGKRSNVSFRVVPHVEGLEEKRHD